MRSPRKIFGRRVIQTSDQCEWVVMETQFATDWERAIRERLMAADDDALGELYDQFGGFVYGLAARVIGCRTAAEDVTQEVFLSLWEKPEQFDPER